MSLPLPYGKMTRDIAIAATLVFGGVAVANHALAPKAPAESVVKFQRDANAILESSSDKWLACGSRSGGERQEYHASDIARDYDSMSSQVQRGQMICSGVLSNKTLG